MGQISTKDKVIFEIIQAASTALRCPLTARILRCRRPEWGRCAPASRNESMHGGSSAFASKLSAAPRALDILSMKIYIKSDLPSVFDVVSIV